MRDQRGPGGIRAAVRDTPHRAPQPKTGARKEQLNPQEQHRNQEESSSSWSCLVAESLAGCCYKVSPCGWVIKKKNLFKRWQAHYWFGGLVVGLFVWGCFLFCFVLFFVFAFVFLFAPTTLPEICLPPTCCRKPKKRNSAGSSCCY